MGKFTPLGRTPLYNGLLFVIPADKDGTYRLGVLTIQNKGKQARLANHDQGGRHREALARARSAASSRKGAKFTGSFTCK